jgi:hypothetical protein
MRRLSSTSCFAAFLAISIGLTPSFARADDPAAAQALFNEAKKLMAAGNYTDACPKLEESQRLAPAMGTKFNLADCYERTGRTASAWAAFLSVASIAKNTNQAAREKAARDRAASLEPKLSRMAVVVPAASRATGLTVTRDGQAVGDAEWGESMPIDPGEHTVAAAAPAKRGWKAIVEVEGAGSSAKVIVPALDDEPTAPSPGPSAPAAVAPAPVAASGSSSTPGWVLIGVGGAALVGGAVVWALRSADESTLDAECGPNGASCPASAAGDISSGKTYTALGVGLFAVGGAGVIAGASWLLLAGHEPKTPSIAGAKLVPALGPRGGGVRVEVAF